MAPLRALLVTTILLAGCQGANPPGPTDPFFGRTRIEPPHTGAVPGPSAVAPYCPAPPQVTLPPTMMPLPGASSTVEPVSSLALNESGDPIAIPEEARRMESPNRQIASRAATTNVPAPEESLKTVVDVPVTLATTASPVVSAGYQETPAADPRSMATATGRERIYQTISPRPKDVLARSSPRSAIVHTASSTPPTARPIDIMDLPPPSNAVQEAEANDGVRLVSATVAIKDPTTAGTTADSFAQPSLYSYDPQYAWLRGRLEYSQIDHCWKLRYIPVDGVTDPFGGSVILANTKALSGYERGNFVEIQGKLGSTNPENRTFSPTFEVKTVKLVRK